MSKESSDPDGEEENWIDYIKRSTREVETQADEMQHQQLGGHPRGTTIETTHRPSPTTARKDGH